MKWMTAGLVLAVSMTLCGVAQAQSIYYEHHGKHHSWGVGLNLGGGGYSYGGGYGYGGGCGGGYSYAPTYYYAPAPAYYYQPAYGYHAHETTHEYTPYSHTDTTYYHYGGVHPTYQSHYYWP